MVTGFSMIFPWLSSHQGLASSCHRDAHCTNWDLSRSRSWRKGRSWERGVNECKWCVFFWKPWWVGNEVLKGWDRYIYIYINIHIPSTKNIPWSWQLMIHVSVEAINWFSSEFFLLEDHPQPKVIRLKVIRNTNHTANQNMISNCH